MKGIVCAMNAERARKLLALIGGDQEWEWLAKQLGAQLAPTVRVMSLTDLAQRAEAGDKTAMEELARRFHPNGGRK